MHNGSIDRGFTFSTNEKGLSKPSKLGNYIQYVHAFNNKNSLNAYSCIFITKVKQVLRTKSSNSLQQIG